MRTFAPNNYSVHSHNSPSNEFLRKSGGPLKEGNKLPPQNTGAPENQRLHQFKPPLPLPCQGDGSKLETPQSQIGANYIKKYYKGKKPLGFHSNEQHDSDIMEETGLSEEDGSVQYSCADMSEALRAARTPHALHVLDTIQDDVESTTTTSGSYVVDPQDLCNEIDDLFFRDMVV